MIEFRDFPYAPEPDRISDRIIEKMSRRFASPELEHLDIVRILTGFYAMRCASGKQIDALFFSHMRESALRSGKINESQFYELFTTLPEGGYGQFMSLKDIAKKTAELKKEGLIVGLKFGHYRRLTMGHIFELVYVRKACDHLVLIIESNKRTYNFKTRNIELTDKERITMFNNSCLVNTLGMTIGEDYTNKYYRDIVKIISPSVLFASALWSEETQREYQKRAALSSSELFIIPKVLNFSTTMMEPLIFRESQPLKFG